MGKKSPSSTYLAAPASVSAAAPVTHVPGAVLKRATKAGPESSPVPAEPLPAATWPRVDDYLDEPDKIGRWERIGSERKEAFPATADHGDPHFELDALLKAHLATDHVGSVDLKTRVSKKQEYASDTCLRPAGVDPETGVRYLEKLVFEVVHKRSEKDTKTRARGFAARGVRRQVGIFVREKKVCEWQQDAGDWGPPMDLNSSLHDPCLAVPLPLAALFDPVLADEAINRAYEAKKHPVFREVERKGEKRGEARGQAKALLALLDARGLTPTAEVRKRLDSTTDLKMLERWIRRAASAASLDEVFDD